LNPIEKIWGIMKEKWNNNKINDEQPEKINKEIIYN
jgi:transposase